MRLKLAHFQDMSDLRKNLNIILHTELFSKAQKHVSSPAEYNTKKYKSTYRYRNVELMIQNIIFFFILGSSLYFRKRIKLIKVSVGPGICKLTFAIEQFLSLNVISYFFDCQGW